MRGSRLNGALAVARDAVRFAVTPSRRNLLHWLSWVVTLSVVLITTVILVDGQIYGWEEYLTRRVQEADYPIWLIRLTSDDLTSTFAWQGLLVIASIVTVLWLLRQRVAAALAVLALPLHVVGNFPKAIVDRDRPSELFEGIFGVGGGRSFPSGHSEFAVTFFGFVAFLVLIHLRGRLQRVGVVLVWLVFAISVGIGRIADGRHWPLDVLIGYVIGIGLLSGLIWLHTAFRRARERAE
ncbi:MAG: phosphatase PAP2 family protein [Chloroflexi bacterium]|nr:phosphatase PAP2 family protein [Chloroflexota bacterium]